MTKPSFDKGKIKILLLEGVHSSALDAPFRSATQLTAQTFANAPRLIGIGCFCIGASQVDLDAATNRSVPAFNAPSSNTRSVAELVLAEIIMLLRGIPQRNASANRGVWVKSAAGSHEVRGKC